MTRSLARPLRLLTIATAIGVLVPATAFAARSGTPGPDRIVLNGAAGTAHGQGGGDTLIGGPGDDKLYGEQGPDRLLGRDQRHRGDWEVTRSPRLHAAAELAG